MGLIGVVIAAVVNLFLQSSALQFAISVIGIFVFLGLNGLGHADHQGAVCREHRRGVAAEDGCLGCLLALSQLRQHLPAPAPFTGERE